MLDMGVIVPKVTSYGGAELFALECVRRWQHHHRVSLYSTQFSTDLLKELEIDPQRVRLVPLHREFSTEMSELLNGSLLPKIWEDQLDEHQIYLAHQWPTHLIDRHPMVWFPHEPRRKLHDMRFVEEGTSRFRMYERNLMQYANGDHDRLIDRAQQGVKKTLCALDQLGRPDRVVANSRATAAYLSRVYNWPVTEVVYPGVNLDDLKPLSCDEPFLLTVHGWHRAKRLRLTLEAMRLEPRIRLCIASSSGEAYYEKRCREMAEALGVADRVYCFEKLKQSELRKLYATCLAVVFMSIREPFGIVPIEALAAGKPLIGVDEGGFTEVVDESCAFLVPPRPQAIADKVRLLLDNPQLGRRMGEAGRARVQSLTWDRTARELLAIMEDTAANWQPRQPSTPPRGDDARPLLGVVYQCGYGDGLGAERWADCPQHAVTDMPVLGYYCSHYGTTIEEHLRSWRQAGIDFAVLNLHARAGVVDGLELGAIENILTMAEEEDHPARFAVQVWPQGCSLEELDQLLGVIRSTLVDRGHYLRWGRQPILFLQWDGAWDKQRQWLEMIRVRTEGFLRIAVSRRMMDAEHEQSATSRLFDSWCLACPLRVAAWEKLEEAWLRARETSALAPGAPTVTSVSPGFDETHMPGASLAPTWTRSCERRDGATYRLMLDAALRQRAAPDLVLVNSFNDFHANTHVEPSLNHGESYWDMTVEFARALRQERRLRAA